jgi:hypothetical protein
VENVECLRSVEREADNPIHLFVHLFWFCGLIQEQITLVCFLNC